MRRLPPIILGSLLSVCLLAGALAAQTGGGPPSPGILPEPLRTTAASLRDEALQGTRAYEIVRSLTTEVGPRPAGSPAFQRAIEWGLRTMRDLGRSEEHTSELQSLAYLVCR